MAVRSLKNSTIENFANYSSSMNAGYSFQDYELIESVFLASNASSVSFNNLNQYSTDYKHLQIRTAMRSTYGSWPAFDLSARFNGDSGANYTSHQLVGTGSAVSSEFNGTNQTSLRCGASTANSPASGIFGSTIVDILDAFATNKNKTTRSLSGTVGSVTNGNYVIIHSGHWRNTESISSIFLFDLYGGNLVAGSRFSLYGIR